MFFAYSLLFVPSGCEENMEQGARERSANRRSLRRTGARGTLDGSADRWLADWLEKRGAVDASGPFRTHRLIAWSSASGGRNLPVGWCNEVTRAISSTFDQHSPQYDAVLRSDASPVIPVSSAQERELSRRTGDPPVSVAKRPQVRLRLGEARGSSRMSGSGY